MKWDRETGIVMGAVLIALLAAHSARPQGEKEKPASEKPAAQAKPAPKAEAKRVLVEATRVSTSDTAKTAAQDATKKGDGEKLQDHAADSAVLEFRPALEANHDAGGAAATTSTDSKKSPARNVHGQVYGSSGAREAGNRGAGGAVGASSKSGKTSVYVETEKRRSTSTSPR